MTNRNAGTLPMKNERATSARIAGFGLILMVILAIFSKFFVLDSFIIAGDAAATAKNIMDNELLFRFGIVSFILVIILDVIVSWALYIFFKPVNKNLSLLTAWFRLVFLTIWVSVFYQLLNIPQLLSGAEYLKAFETDQLHAQVMMAIDAFSVGWKVSLIFFGMHILLPGYMVIKSDSMSKIIGVLLIIASAGYFLDSFAQFLLPNYMDYETMFLAIVAITGIIGETSFLVWLLIKGVKVDK